MIRNISIGIDVGSSTTRVVVAEFLKGEKNPKIIGVGESETNGMRHGYVVHSASLVHSIKQAVAEAEKTAGLKIKRAAIAVGGISLRSEISTGMAIVSKADGEVTNLDINKALEDCENNLHLGNKKVIHSYSISYKLDSKEVLGRLEGMRGTKLEVKALFVTCSTQHLEDLISVIEEAGIEATDWVASPNAASHIALSPRQKVAGSLLVNIGGETVSIAVYENNLLISLYTFSIGGADITNDIALGLRIPLEKAESFKMGNITEDYSQKKLAEIIEARLGDIFELIENHLKKIKRNELLPAGVVFVGGGSNVAGLEDFSKSALRLPSRVGSTEMFGSAKTKLRDPSWFVALGLVVAPKEESDYSDSSFPNLFKDIKNSIKSSIKQLMP